MRGAVARTQTLHVRGGGRHSSLKTLKRWLRVCGGNNTEPQNTSRGKLSRANWQEATSQADGLLGHKAYVELSLTGEPDRSTRETCARFGTTADWSCASSCPLHPTECAKNNGEKTNFWQYGRKEEQARQLAPWGGVVKAEFQTVQL